MSIATGTRLGQYEVQDFIGQGAMGVVYRAYHPELERTGAVKIMQAISPDPDSVTRFRHEAQAIAQLRHPNIVNVYDFGAFQGTPYMIVEYVPGGSLATRMSEGRMDQNTAVRYLRGIAAGLDYAHGHGVVHRDVKPANVLLTADDTPVLADFGLAKLLAGSSLKSLTGFTTGTPAYMAPEQVAGHHVGPPADRYSLATIAYEMLTGVIPFDGEALMEMLYAQVHREPPPPSSRLPDLGPAVDAVILRGLAKDPDARWGSGTEFVEELAKALRTPEARSAAGVRAVAVTMPMAPAQPMPSTVPFTRTAMAERPAANVAEPTVVMAFPEAMAPAPAPASQFRRLPKRRILIGLAALLALLLVFGTCAVLAEATTLSVNPDRASRGDMVTIKATHVPANKAGEIQLWSVVHTFPFQADGNGAVTVYMRVPTDIALGDHVVKICWDNSCHQQAPLKVVAGVAEVLPTPTAGPSASRSPGSSPTPGHGATPTPTPSSGGGGGSSGGGGTSGGGGGSTGGGSTPTPTPPPPPPPTPTPPPNPCPGNSSSLALTPASQTVVGGSKATFSGSNFTPNKPVSVTYEKGSTSTPLLSVTASCTGGISITVTTPTGIARTDHVVVCDVSKGCATETLGILL